MKKYRFLALLLLLALVLPTSAMALEDPAPEVGAALLVDATYNEVLYELNAHEKRDPSDLTKVMTALLALEAVDRGELALDSMISAPQGIHFGLGARDTTQNIRSGELLSLQDLLYCILLPSANEACNVIAHAVSGGTKSFVALMNQRAEELGMTNTHFTTTHGLYDEDQYSTAWDLWLLAKTAMENETFRDIVQAKEYHIPPTNISKERHFYNTNALLSQLNNRGYVYPPAFGIKAGATGEHNLCLMSAAEVDTRTLYCIVLGAKLTHQEDNSYKRMNFSESIRLYEWGFDNFSYRTILEGAAPVAELPVTLSDTDHVLVRAEGSVAALLPKDVKVEDFEQNVTLFVESVEAPVQEGQVFGKITLTYDGEEYGTLDLVALNNVERSELLYRIDCAEKFLANTWVKVAIIAFGVLIILLVIIISTHTKRKRRRSRSYVGGGGYGGGGYSGRKRR